MKLSNSLPCLFAMAAFLGVASAFPSPKNKMRKLNTVDLKNGAQLSMDMLNPPTDASFAEGVPVPVQGIASVGLGHPDVAYIYIIDKSGSTDIWDGDCGTELECVQKFFLNLHDQAISDGSAVLTAVIDFDDMVHTSTGFLDPSDAEIENAIMADASWGGTDCADALLEAKKLIEDPSNTAGTTVVVFAGDGQCNELSMNSTTYDVDEDLRQAADALGATGAIVHTIAVGDEVDCNSTSKYGDSNNLPDIPQNGGRCTSVPDANTLPDIIDDLIGTSLLSVELRVDNANYTEINVSNNSQPLPLPQDGAVVVDFSAIVHGLEAGDHMICARATGNDTLGGLEQIEDCHKITVEPTTAPPTTVPLTTQPPATRPPTTKPPPTNPPSMPPADDQLLTESYTDTGISQGLRVFVIVAFVCMCIFVVGYTMRARATGIEEVGAEHKAELETKIGPEESERTDTTETDEARIV